VNSVNSGDELYPAVAMGSTGNFVITWSTSVGSDAGVRAQRYDASGVAQGGQIQVNTHTTGDQIYSSVAMIGSDKFVITWTSIAQDGSGWGVYAQRFNSDGTYNGNEFRVNTTTAGDQMYSRVSGNSSGQFVIIWQSYNQDAPSTWGVYGQEYAASGVAQGSEF